MPMVPFTWSSVEEFLGRDEELAALERWWSDADRTPLSLYGRRRAGKSWLARRLAHGKPAVILVARRAATGELLDDFADRLEPVLGVRPALTNVADLFRVLYRTARSQELLVVIDEFPYLLSSTQVQADRELTSIAAVMEEERDDSRLKLLLCGSLVGQMEALLSERGPLHGRLRPLQLHPMAFPEARLFLAEHDPISQFERFAIAGGMPRYLGTLGGGASLREVVCERLLNTNASLFNEGRTILEQELREPKVYFSILRQLASGEKDSADLVGKLHLDANVLSKYLGVLADLRLVDRRLPVGAEPSSRGGHWHLRDPFFRSWFRYVFPFQDDLEGGLRPEVLFDLEVAPSLNDHVGEEFEAFCRRWTRSSMGVTKVGSWWGHALHRERQSKTRLTEEIDVVGLAGQKVTVLGEARWRTRPMGLDYLDEIERYKLPALRQSHLTVVENPTILLFSRGGYTDGLLDAASRRSDLVLVDVPTCLDELRREEESATEGGSSGGALAP